MDILKLSVIARWRIMEILNKQGTGKDGERKYEQACDLYDKICIRDEEMEKLFIQNGDGTSRPNDQAWRAAETHDVQLNFSELERLEEILKDTMLRPIDRQAWSRNVLNQLKDLKAPRTDSEQTKEKRLADIRSAKR